MKTNFEFQNTTDAAAQAPANDGEAFRQGDWLCHRAPNDIIAHGADGTTVTIAKKGGTVCDIYSPAYLNMPPLFPKSPLDLPPKK